VKATPMIEWTRDAMQSVASVAGGRFACASGCCVARITLTLKAAGFFRRRSDENENRSGCCLDDVAGYGLCLCAGRPRRSRRAHDGFDDGAGLGETEARQV